MSTIPPSQGQASDKQEAVSDKHAPATPLRQGFEGQASYQSPEADLAKSGLPATPQNSQKNSNLLQGIGLVWELGWIIAVPVLILGFGGAYLDKKWGTAPWLLLAGFAIAFILSLAAAIHRVKEYLKTAP
ncbi:MAG: AtpZ/AtpI family protein [Candidatus Peribacteraceae bacterium]|nr:AtpZ/AtpI family protein [Candidatus Peribacteraceae bacterium]